MRAVGVFMGQIEKSRGLEQRWQITNIQKEGEREKDEEEEKKVIQFRHSIYTYIRTLS